jgi:peptide/nickel transport system permease protein
MRHALRNGLIPIVTLFGIQLPALIGGTVVLETIFSVPGMGTYLIDALSHRDYPIIQAIVLVTAFVVVFTNLVVDASYSIIDPRIRPSS